MRRDRLLVWLLAVPLLPIVLQSRWLREQWEWRRPWGDPLDRSAMHWAGFGATDCGHVLDATAAGSRIEADACSVAAFQASRPFRVFLGDASDSCWIAGNTQRRLRIEHCSGSVCESLGEPSPNVIRVGGRERLEAPSARPYFRCP